MNHRPKLSLESLAGQMGIPASGGTETRYNCPICPAIGSGIDTKAHLYIHTCGPKCNRCRNRSHKDSYFCQRCGSKGKLSTSGISSYSTDLNTAYDDAVKLFLSDGAISPTKEYAPLPPDFSPVVYPMDSWDYLISRGILPEDISWYGIGITPKYRNRIIVPSYDKDGDVIFWTGRTYRGDENPKYYNPKGSFRRSTVFNLHRAARTGHVIITEGVFSAMAVSRSAVATYGKCATITQIELIVDTCKYYNVKRVSVAFDGDASDESLELADSLRSFGLDCELVIVLMPPLLDPADLGREKFLELERSAFDYDPLNMIIKKLEELI